MAASKTSTSSENVDKHLGDEEVIATLQCYRDAANPGQFSRLISCVRRQDGVDPCSLLNCSTVDELIYATAAGHKVLIRKELANHQSSTGQIFFGYWVPQLGSLGMRAPVEEVAVKAVIHDRKKETLAEWKKKRREKPNEANLWKSLRHDNIVRLYRHYFATDGFRDIELYVNEFFNGGSLFHYRLQREFSFNNRPELSRWVTGEICKGVRYLHRRRLAHRDIKLENIFVSKGGRRVAIGDFGSLVQMNSIDDTMYEEEGMTLAYDPPEVGIKNGKSPAEQPNFPYNPFKLDVWTVGVCAYMLLTGNNPFEVDDLRAGRANLLSMDGLTQEDFTFLQNIWAIKPQHRPTIDQVMSSRWFDAFREDLNEDLEVVRYVKP